MDRQSMTVVESMNSDQAGIPREFLLKQIENEINAGFAFVASARTAYKLSQPGVAEGALEKASEAHKQILRELSDSPSAQVRTIVHQLRELREAIDWIRETHFEQPSEKR